MSFTEGSIKKTLASKSIQCAAGRMPRGVRDDRMVDVAFSAFNPAKKRMISCSALTSSIKVSILRSNGIKDRSPRGQSLLLADCAVEFLGIFILCSWKVPREVIKRISCALCDHSPKSKRMYLTPQGMVKAQGWVLEPIIAPGIQFV